MKLRHYFLSLVGIVILVLYGSTNCAAFNYYTVGWEIFLPILPKLWVESKNILRFIVLVIVSIRNVIVNESRERRKERHLREEALKQFNS